MVSAEAAPEVDLFAMKPAETAPTAVVPPAAPAAVSAAPGLDLFGGKSSAALHAFSAPLGSIGFLLSQKARLNEAVKGWIKGAAKSFRYRPRTG